MLRTVDQNHAGKPRARLCVAWQTQLTMERPAVFGLERDFGFGSQSLDIFGEPSAHLFLQPFCAAENGCSMAGGQENVAGFVLREVERFGHLTERLLVIRSRYTEDGDIVAGADVVPGAVAQAARNQDQTLHPGTFRGFQHSVVGSDPHGHKTDALRVHTVLGSKKPDRSTHVELQLFPLASRKRLKHPPVNVAGCSSKVYRQGRDAVVVGKIAGKAAVICEANDPLRFRKQNGSCKRRAGFLRKVKGAVQGQPIFGLECDDGLRMRRPWQASQ